MHCLVIQLSYEQFIDALEKTYSSSTGCCLIMSIPTVSSFGQSFVMLLYITTPF